MAWTIEYTESARGQLNKLNKEAARRIRDYMVQRVAARDDPRTLGKLLSGPMSSFWRYRLGNYRIICDIKSTKLSVLVVRIGARDAVYRKKPK